MFVCVCLLLFLLPCLLFCVDYFFVFFVASFGPTWTSWWFSNKTGRRHKGRFSNGFVDNSIHVFIANLKAISFILSRWGAPSGVHAGPCWSHKSRFLSIRKTLSTMYVLLPTFATKIQNVKFAVKTMMRWSRYIEMWYYMLLHLLQFSKLPGCKLNNHYNL